MFQSLSDRYSKQDQLKILNFAYSFEDLPGGHLVSDIRSILPFDDFVDSLKIFIENLFQGIFLYTSKPVQQEALKCLENQKLDELSHLLNGVLNLAPEIDFVIDRVMYHSHLTIKEIYHLA